MNRKLIKKFAYYFTKPFSFEFLRARSKENFIFPFYHIVSENTPSYIKDLYPVVSPLRFKADLDFLQKYYKSATTQDLIHFHKSGKQSNKPLFFLSFDDGLKECYKIVYPILKENQIEAAFFINPDFVDNKTIFFRFKTSIIINEVLKITDKKILNKIAKIISNNNWDKEICIKKIAALTFSEDSKIEQISDVAGIDFTEKLNTEKIYMTLNQLKELNENGFLIGSHSMNHPLFSELDYTQQIEQVEQSIVYIKREFTPKISTFAFPFTDFDVQANFFKYLNDSEEIDITFGTAGIKNDSSPKHIQRIPMESFEGDSAERIIRTEYAYYWLKSFFGKNTIRR